MADNRGAPPSRGFRGDGKKKEQAHHQPPYQYPNRGELRHRAPRQTVKEAPPAVAFRSQLPNPWGSGGGPRLLPVSHRYSKIPNAPPLCHPRSALSQPSDHSNDTLSKVRVLGH